MIVSCVVILNKKLNNHSAPNFITEIFYLTSAVNHYGLNRTIQSFDDLYKQTEEIQRHIDYLTSTMETLPAGVSIMLWLS